MRTTVRALKAGAGFGYVQAYDLSGQDHLGSIAYWIRTGAGYCKSLKVREDDNDLYISRICS